jgi:hypothetical protein
VVLWALYELLWKEGHCFLFLQIVYASRVLFEAVKLSTIIANNRAGLVLGWGCLHSFLAALSRALLERNLLLYRWGCNLLLFACLKPQCCSRKQGPRSHVE